MDKMSKHYTESKTVSKVEKEKKCETFEQRAKKYSFNPLKTLFVGGLLATTGMGGVEGRQFQETGLCLSEQKNVTRPEIVPSGFTDYLRKVGASESLIQKVERRQRRLAEQKNATSVPEQQRLGPSDNTKVRRLDAPPAIMCDGPSTAGCTRGDKTDHPKMTIQAFFNKFNGKGMDFDCADGYQCMDLAEEYNRDVVGATKSIGGNAIDVWTNYPTDLYTKIVNTPTNFPNEGDLVLWNTNVGEFGHIALCQSADVKKFTSFDQNWPAGSCCHFQWHDYHNVLGWLRPKQ